MKKSNVLYVLGILAFVVYMFATNLPRFIYKGGLRRVEGTQEEAVERLRRLGKLYCRQPEKVNEDALLKRLEGDLEEFHQLGEAGMLLITEAYVFHWRTEERAISAYPRNYVPEDDIGREQIFDNSASRSFYMDCNFVVHYLDMEGNDPATPRGMLFYGE